MMNHLKFFLSAAVLFAVLAPASSAPKGFVTAKGDQFVVDGKVYRIKGSNYYPRQQHWAKMWQYWDWSDILREADMMQSYGLNAVRILVPYRNGGWDGPNPPEERLKMLEDLVTMLGRKGIRSCVTLFDWETSFPPAGDPKEAEHLKHLDAIVGRLKNNKYVLMWDVKNEPDHPANTKAGDNWDKNPEKRDQIVSWLRRMCKEVKKRDPNHLVGVGLRWYENFSDIKDFVDIAIYHSYWESIAEKEIESIKADTKNRQMPILVEEFGWPSHPNPADRDGKQVNDYSEERQLQFYKTYLPLFEKHNIAGCIQWMTFDAKAYSNKSTDSFENYFGLWRFDQTLKPAGEYYRDNFKVNPFPN